MVYSENKANAAVVNEFKELMRKAQLEHSKTAAGKIEKRLKEKDLENVDDETVDSILRGSLERINERLDEHVGLITNDVSITENELREFRGIIYIKPNEYSIKILDIEKNHWKELAEKEENPAKKRLYEAIADTAELKADELRLRFKLRPEGELANSIIDEEMEANDLTRLERFKRWAKNNLIGLSAIAITIAGIITSIVIAARSTLKKGAQVTGKLAKALYNVGKKLDL